MESGARPDKLDLLRRLIVEFPHEAAAILASLPVIAQEDGRGPLSRRRDLAEAVVELQDRVAQLQRETRTDALTGLLNRRALDEVLDLAPGGAGTATQRNAVAFIDIDHFHDFNHLHGDARGDEALTRVAAALRGCLRNADLVFRKGGEEFVVVLPDIVPGAEREWGERMRLAVEQLAIPHGGSTTSPVLTVTLGISCGAAHRTLRQLMYGAAELVMSAKRTDERNRVQWMSMDEGSAAQATLDLGPDPLQPRHP